MAYRIRLDELEGSNNQYPLESNRSNFISIAGARGYGDSSKESLETTNQERLRNLNLRRTNSRNSDFIEGYENLQIHSDMPAPIKEYTIQEIGLRIENYIAGSFSSLKHYQYAKHVRELYKPYKQ